MRSCGAKLFMAGGVCTYYVNNLKSEVKQIFAFYFLIPTMIAGDKFWRQIQIGGVILKPWSRPKILCFATLGVELSIFTYSMFESSKGKTHNLSLS